MEEFTLHGLSEVDFRVREEKAKFYASICVHYGDGKPDWSGEHKNAFGTLEEAQAYLEEKIVPIIELYAKATNLGLEREEHKVYPPGRPEGMECTYYGNDRVYCRQPAKWVSKSQNTYLKDEYLCDKHKQLGLENVPEMASRTFPIQ